jgi:predicted MPP superfamily phosphohydrolase
MIFFILAMMACPFVQRVSEKAGHHEAATFAAYIGYSWLGLVFLFVSASFVLEIYRLFLHASGLLLKTDFSSVSVSARPAFFVPLGLALLIASYGYFEAKQIRTEHVRIRTTKLPAGLDRLRIVQISDVHLGLIVREERLKRILSAVEKAGPDLLVSTGDLVDADICRMRTFADLLAEVRPKYGKFGITGNHEFYAGLEQALDCARKADITMLRGKSVTVEGLINIAGVDDPAAEYFKFAPTASEEEVLSNLPPGRFNLLLKHRPVIDKNSLGLFDLQLSGHAHKGQIFPFSLFTKLYYYPVNAGLLELENGSRIYVSRGSGTWGPPIRFLAPPEVTVIDLIRDDTP